ncbi:hypothetical protein EBN15_13860 [Xanthomonas cucurbitae]|nr:hypothetical protein EBN15_13860 [Xanthomonas cucurbitae]
MQAQILDRCARAGAAARHITSHHAKAALAVSTRSLLFNRTTNQLSGVVSLPIAGPLAAWMPPSSPHGRVNGVSRER